MALAYDDIHWSAETAGSLRAADAAIERIATAFEEEQDEQGARIARDVGAVVVGCVAAVCSAIADLTFAIRDRPS